MIHEDLNLISANFDNVSMGGSSILWFLEIDQKLLSFGIKKASQEVVYDTPKEKFTFW